MSAESAATPAAVAAQPSVEATVHPSNAPSSDLHSKKRPASAADVSTEASPEETLTKPKEKKHKKKKTVAFDVDGNNTSFKAELLLNQHGPKILQKLISNGEMRTDLFREIAIAARKNGTDLGLPQIALKSFQYTAVLRVLRDIGLDLNHSNSLLLRLAANKKCHTTVQFLLENGADATADDCLALLDAYGQTPGSSQHDAFMFQMLLDAIQRFRGVPEKLLTRVLSSSDLRTLQALLSKPDDADETAYKNILKKLVTNSVPSIDAIRLFICHKPAAARDLAEQIYTKAVFVKDVELVSMLVEKDILPTQETFTKMASDMDPYAHLILYEAFVKKMQKDDE